MTRNRDPSRRSFGIYTTRKSFQQALATDFEDSVAKDEQSQVPIVDDNKADSKSQEVCTCVYTQCIC